MRKYKRILLAALAAAAIAAGAATQESSIASSKGHMTLGRESSLAKKGSFDITEELFASQDDDNNGDVPVVPGLASSAGGRSSAGRESS